MGGRASLRLSLSLTRSRFSPPLRRVYINFYDMAPANVGWNGSTFA